MTLSMYSRTLSTSFSLEYVQILPWRFKTGILNDFKAGQRSDILFTPKSSGSVWMRTQSLGQFCSRSFNSAARGVVLVDGADLNTTPNTTAWPAPPDNGQCAGVNDCSPLSFDPADVRPGSIEFNNAILPAGPSHSERHLRLDHQPNH